MAPKYYLNEGISKPALQLHAGSKGGRRPEGGWILRIGVLIIAHTYVGITRVKPSCAANRIGEDFCFSYSKRDYVSDHRVIRDNAPRQTTLSQKRSKQKCGLQLMNKLF